jgi:hypothetical protein
MVRGAVFNLAATHVLPTRPEVALHLDAFWFSQIAIRCVIAFEWIAS